MEGRGAERAQETGEAAVAGGHVGGATTEDGRERIRAFCLLAADLPPPPVCALFSAIGALKGQMEGETSVPQVSLSASGPRLSVNLKEEGGVVGRDGVRVSAHLLFLKEINSLNHDQVMTKQDSPLCHLV